MPFSEPRTLICPRPVPEFSPFTKTLFGVYSVSATTSKSRASPVAELVPAATKRMLWSADGLSGPWPSRLECTDVVVSKWRVSRAARSCGDS